MGKTRPKSERNTRIPRFETWITHKVFKISACDEQHPLLFAKRVPTIPNTWQFELFCPVLATREPLLPAAKIWRNVIAKSKARFDFFSLTANWRSPNANEAA